MNPLIPIANRLAESTRILLRWIEDDTPDDEVSQDQVDDAIAEAARALLDLDQYLLAQAWQQPLF
jgi:hypothetical protein